ncbi:9329_t:CDS:2, partial [Acaulospora colombiana]
PLRYSSVLLPSNTTNSPYMNPHSTSTGRDVTESERDDHLVRSRLPETRVSSNYHQVDDIIQANQASRMLLVWSIMDTSTNKNLNRRRGRHLSLKEIPVCAIPWHVDDPRKASKQKVVRDTSGTIPHDVYDSFYEVVSNKKRSAMRGDAAAVVVLFRASVLPSTGTPEARKSATSLGNTISQPP